MKRSRWLLGIMLLRSALFVQAGPKGHLFVIGGGSRSESMMKRFVELASGFGSGTIVVLPMASAAPDESGEALVGEPGARFDLRTRKVLHP